jgi:hypothetical protein
MLARLTTEQHGDLDFPALLSLLSRFAHGPWLPSSTTHYALREFATVTIIQR